MIAAAQTGAAPLARHNLFQTDDLDRARAIVARQFCDHRLERASREAPFAALHNRAAGQALSLNYLCYGADVCIDPGELRGFYLIQIPVAGGAEMANGGDAVTVGRGAGTILNPTRPTRMRWGAGCQKLLIQIERRALNALAADWAGHELPASVLFRTHMDFTTAPGRDWLRRAMACFRAAECGQVFGAARTPAQGLIEEELMLSLLRFQENSAQHFLDRPATGPVPAHVRRARDIIHARLTEEFTMRELAAEAGTSLRNLQVGFAQSHGMGPLQYLRGERLKLARFRLISDGPGARVGDIATALGFAHLGRFSSAYRAAFGETPRQTLARGAP